MRCLLIETKDKRKFFTHEKNLPQLIEFSKHFKATISLVRAKNCEILDLEELAPAICDASYQKKKYQYEIIENKLTALNKTKNTRSIEKFLSKRLLSHNSVSLKLLKKKYNALNISVSALCNIFKKVRTELETQGYRIIKTGAGEYKVL